MICEMGFEALLMHLGFGPGEGCGGVVVGRDEGIDVGLELGDGVERCAGKRFASQDGEPDLDLIEPGGPRRGEVEVDVAVALEPSVMLGLVGAEVVEDDMDLVARVLREEAIHEVEELDTASAA